MESNLATVNLSDFSHIVFTLSIKSLEIISFLEFLLDCLGYVVCVLTTGFGVWVVYYAFSFICVVSQSFLLRTYRFSTQWEYASSSNLG